jgi:DNA-binding IclR family transcriptional regulator
MSALTSLEEQFAEIRSTGWACTVGEYDVGVPTLAVPVFLRDEPYGSLSVGWQSEQYQHDPRVGGDVREVSFLVSLRLTSPVARHRRGRRS